MKKMQIVEEAAIWVSTASMLSKTQKAGLGF